jgi:hypothetical protein
MNVNKSIGLGLVCLAGTALLGGHRLSRRVRVAMVAAAALCGAGAWLRPTPTSPTSPKQGREPSPAPEPTIDPLGADFETWPMCDKKQPGRFYSLPQPVVRGTDAEGRDYLAFRYRIGDRDGWLQHLPADDRFLRHRPIQHLRFCHVITRGEDEVWRGSNRIAPASPFSGDRFDDPETMGQLRTFLSSGKLGCFVLDPS